MENQKTNYEKTSNDSESSSKNKIASLAMGLPLWGLLIIDLVFAGWGFGFPSKLTFIIDALVFGILAYISYQHVLNKTNPINLVIRNYTPKDFLWTNILICALSLIMAFAMKR
jgi:hypothetical protein